MNYTVRPVQSVPPVTAAWNSPAWAHAETLVVSVYYPRSSDHHPLTEARLLYDPRGIYVAFRVQDQYVISTATKYQDQVCKDSCVEFFVQPRPNAGYFNIEMNCGGVTLIYFVEDHRIVNRAFAKHTEVEKRLFDQMRIGHSMPVTVPEEIKTPVAWEVAYFVPFALFEHYLGRLGEVAGQTWRANFYKCASLTSHPHWASWAPIEGDLNFHKPEFFAPIHFARD